MSFCFSVAMIKTLTFLIIHGRNLVSLVYCSTDVIVYDGVEVAGVGS